MTNVGGPRTLHNKSFCSVFGQTKLKWRHLNDRKGTLIALGMLNLQRRQRHPREATLRRSRGRAKPHIREHDDQWAYQNFVPC